MPLTKAQLNEWCDTLEKYPERQYRNELVDETGTKFCCLGQLAVLNGAEIVHPVGSADMRKALKFASDDNSVIEQCVLRGDIASMFGEESGRFNDIGMPNMLYGNRFYYTATQANDDGVPWGVIAKHFREHYKTQD